MDDTGENDIDMKRRLLLAGAAGTALVGTMQAVAAGGAGAAKYRPVTARRIPAHGLASYASGETLRPLAFERRALRPNDVMIDIHYCGVCHSDIHVGHGDWNERHHPIVPGHEIAGVVIAAGSAVTDFRIGERVGVGAMVDSCGVCQTCRDGQEQYCENGALFTHGTSSPQEPGGYTQGGYSNVIVVHDRFVIHIPDMLELAEAGPLMCAAVTVYAPLRHWQVRPGSRIGIVGLGGLGHLGVQLGRAMGAEVVVFTTSPDKVADALHFGASDVVVNADPQGMARHAAKLDFILDTVPYRHGLGALISLLRRDATLCLVGIGRVSEPNELFVFSTIGRRNSFAGSLIGSIRETQEVVDFCAGHGIRPAITVIAAQDVDHAWERVVAKQARYRYVIDMKTLQSA